MFYTLEAACPLHSYEVQRTAPAVIERIRALAPAYTDAQIATQLNAEGHSPGESDTFTAAKIHWRINRVGQNGDRIK
jgi:hypothetical protein